MLSCPDLNLVSLIPVVLVLACRTSASFGIYPDAPIRCTSSKKLRNEIPSAQSRVPETIQSVLRR